MTRMRFAWLADAECEDSYSAREARVLLRAMAQDDQIVPLWFAAGSRQPPHFWNGMRVFPVPSGTLDSADYLHTLIAQQCPHAILSNLPMSSMSGVSEHLRCCGLPWIQRVSPDDVHGGQHPSGSILLVAEEGACAGVGDRKFVPYIRGFDPQVSNGADAVVVLEALQRAIRECRAESGIQGAAPGCHLVMRQHLFCNTSVAQVMFELTNALIDLGVPVVPQDEHAIFNGGYIEREEELYRSGAPEKYRRVLRALDERYDPDTATTVHFVLPKSATAYTRDGVFPALAGREALYITGNHTIKSQAEVRVLADNFEKLIFPSEHVLRPYRDAGLNHRQGAIVPHGIDPAIFSPEAKPVRYPSPKQFIFLQTSFPWYQKGFDLSIRAFCRTFSSRDDACLVLRVPRVKASERSDTLGRVEEVVAAETGKPGAPEVLLLEWDVPPDQRAGLYTGADCYVHPLRAEGFGITILEAMACGLPTIAPAWSGPADFLSPCCSYPLRFSGPIAERATDGSISRYHVDPDVDHLCYLMRRVYEHRDEARVLGRKASEVAHSQWTWRHAAQKLASLLSFWPRTTMPLPPTNPTATCHEI